MWHEFSSQHQTCLTSWCHTTVQWYKYSPAVTHLGSESLCWQSCVPLWANPLHAPHKILQWTVLDASQYLLQVMILLWISSSRKHWYMLMCRCSVSTWVVTGGKPMPVFFTSIDTNNSFFIGVAVFILN